MKTIPPIADRLHEMVRRSNAELATQAALKAGLGLAFTFFTFGFVFWLSCFVGFFVAGVLKIPPWQFGVIVSGLFLIVASWSAWRRVDPLAGLRRLTDEE